MPRIPKQVLTTGKSERNHMDIILAGAAIAKYHKLGA
jgi:hypothetical protein